MGGGGGGQQSGMREKERRVKKHYKTQMFIRMFITQGLKCERLSDRKVCVSLCVCDDEHRWSAPLPSPPPQGTTMPVFLLTTLSEGCVCVCVYMHRQKRFISLPVENHRGIMFKGLFQSFLNVNSTMSFVPVSTVEMGDTG